MAGDRGIARRPRQGAAVVVARALSEVGDRHSLHHDLVDIDRRDLDPGQCIAVVGEEEGEDLGVVAAWESAGGGWERGDAVVAPAGCGRCGRRCGRRGGWRWRAVARLDPGILGEDRLENLGGFVEATVEVVAQAVLGPRFLDVGAPGLERDEEEDDDSRDDHRPTERAEYDSDARGRGR